jgi:hypothetical protein
MILYEIEWYRGEFVSSPLMIVRGGDFFILMCTIEIGGFKNGRTLQS